jgi:hypothetical protein
LKKKLIVRQEKILRLLNRPKSLKKLTEEYLGEPVLYDEFIRKMARVRYTLSLLINEGKVVVRETEAERGRFAKKLYTKVG